MSSTKREQRAQLSYVLGRGVGDLLRFAQSGERLREIAKGAVKVGLIESENCSQRQLVSLLHDLRKLPAPARARSPKQQ